MSDRFFFGERLFEQTLIAPFSEGANALRIVSGYASAAMAADHILQLQNIERELDISLIYGMAGTDGVSKANHEGFLSLQDKREFDFRGHFVCAYIRAPWVVHSKLYVWCKDNSPIMAFAGSANYTINGFRGGGHRQEILVECDPRLAMEYWEQAHIKSVPCKNADIHGAFVKTTVPKVMPPSPSSVILLETDPKSPFYGHAKVELPLLTRNGDLGNGSGLNWGVRPGNVPRDDGNALRNPNQAYIRLESKVYATDFFPPIGHRFTVLTDDGHIFSCSRAQDHGKAIHTPQDNAEFGRYFRTRLKVPLNSYIPPQALLRYGRQSVTFYKLDAENYVMDFSPPKQKQSN